MNEIENAMKYFRKMDCEQEIRETMMIYNLSNKYEKLLTLIE